MKIVVISDTHGEHERVSVPEADTVIHCGDFCASGNPADARFFLRWFYLLPHRNKILIAGNHDLCMENVHARKMRAEMPAGIHYLEDSGVDIGGLKFWGSPVQPFFLDWAFNRQRGPQILKHWKMIPTGTDVVITHGPPARILDGHKVKNFLTGETETIGCEDLAREINGRIKPRLHCFGHVHCGYGQLDNSTTRFINAAICDEAYRPVNAPVTVEI